MSTIDRDIDRWQKIRERDGLDEEGFPWLENGDEMTQPEFHERYKKMPPGVKAELIGGIVYIMASTVPKGHGRGHANASGWLFNYGAETPGTEGQNKATTILNEENELQPDSALLILEDHGGQSKGGEGENDYTYGAPELIVEVSNTSRTLDLGQKFREYEAAGVREYIVLDLKARAVRWFVASAEGRFEPLPVDPDGLFRSRVFPGLWLDPDALLRNDKRALIAGLRRGLETPEHAAFVAELERRYRPPTAE